MADAHVGPRAEQADHAERELARALSAGPKTAAQLMVALGVSQPTLSRTIRERPERITSFRLKGQRTPLYGLLRPLPMGLNPRQRIHRYLSQGHMRPFADVEFLAGGATLERADQRTTLYEGLPPYMAFAAPSGFLGRQLAQEAAQGLGTSQPFPANLKDWSDEHRVAYLFTQGMNLPGNLVFGDGPLQKEMQLRAAAPISAAAKPAHYAAMASSLAAAAFGSSAGGEQPKFLSLAEDAGHVIVKFAKLGSRMAELLPLEHLALRTLAEFGIPAAPTQLLAAGGHVFLEVSRFDRVGLSGRIGMLSAGAVDDEYFGLRDNWSAFARRCVQAQVLSPVDARHVHSLAAFSELIGNNDRHFENLSLLIEEDGEYRGLAPAYDILPMRYASIGGGIDPELKPIEPKIGHIGTEPAVWQLAAEAAAHFWRAVQTAQLAAPVSPALRRLAKQNLAAAMAFAAPFLPV